MADLSFEAEIDLDVSFNEFDEELSEFQEENYNTNVQTTVTNNNQKETTECELDTHELAIKKQNKTNENYTDGVQNSAKAEDGEISDSNDEENEEKMDCDEETGTNPNSIKTMENSAEVSKETVTSSFTFLPPSKECSKEELVDEEFMSDTNKSVEIESVNLSMESDNSMDDQSWKRHKRAKLEHGSKETGKEKKSDEKDGKRVKPRGGQKKRKRPLRDYRDGERRYRHHNLQHPEFSKIFEPLRVTSDDSEEAVARELAEKLNESKVGLIQRVVTCIGCEKAIKLFKETKEVQKRGGMWTQERDRRRTSGGIFLMFLKNKYVTKEESKWIFALENELMKKKAKEQQQIMKERRKKEVTDLRLKLKEKDDE